jgi:hypothetical protein
MMSLPDVSERLSVEGARRLDGDFSYIGAEIECAGHHG